MDDQIGSSKGYSHKELSKAFQLSQNAEHWKNPIDAWIHPKKFEVCDEACCYFTGSRLNRAQWSGESAVRVTAPGYFLTIGA